MQNITSTRLTTDIEKDLEIVAKTEHLDKSAVIRRLLFDALKEWKKDYAIKMYKELKFSTEQAAKFANLSIWKFFDLLKERKITVNYDLEELERDLKTIKWKHEGNK